MGSVRFVGQSCVPDSPASFGQNHPVSAMNEGTAPMTTAHGVKMEPMNIPEIASADRSGQMLGSGNTFRWSGSASRSDVTSTSRLSLRRPTTTG
jgi:hypothetical protein